MTTTPAYSDSITDPNGQTTSYYYDEMNRPTSVQYPNQGTTTYSYNDAPQTPGACPTTANVTVTQAITSSQNKVESAIVDGLGRLVRTQLNSDPDGTDCVDITYDGLGRKVAQTNPYRSTHGQTDGVTQYQYDALQSSEYNRQRGRHHATRRQRNQLFV